MERKTLILAAAGALATIIYIIIAGMVKATESIWVLTRIFGLISFISLFLALALGEIRLLFKIKGDFELFRFHTPLAIFSTFMVLLHFISAASDKFKWGKALNFQDFLGFSFSDRWLILLSLGTLAFYLMLLVGMTSAKKSMQLLGFRKWKLVHYLSYAAFLIAYIHSMNLGTDLRHSALDPIFYPMFLMMFLITAALLLTRVATTFIQFEDQSEINLAAVFIILVVLGSAFTLKAAIAKQDRIDELELRINSSQAAIDDLQKTNQVLTESNIKLTNAIGELNG